MRHHSDSAVLAQVYEAKLAAPLTDKEAEAATRRFASGSIVLQGDFEPLLPAKLVPLGEDRVRVSIQEGRYHQIRRMFSSIGHEVLRLHRVSVGGLSLAGLPEGEWRYLSQADIDDIFSGVTTEEIMTQLTDGIPSGTSLALKRKEEDRSPLAQQAADVDAEDDDNDVAVAGRSPTKKMRVDDKIRRRRAALKMMVEKL